MVSWLLTCFLALADAPADGAAPDASLSSPHLKPGYRAFPGLVTAENSRHWDLELLYLADDPNTGYAAAKAKQALAPKDPEPYWHIVRFMYDIGETRDWTGKHAEKDAFYTEMLDWAQRGLDLAPEDPHLRFARGIAMGRLGTTRGVLSSLSMARDLESDWQFAANSGFVYATADEREVLPCDIHQGLAVFYRLVPEWWIVGVISGTKGDIEKSVWHMEQANACAPGMIRNMKELGVAQLCYAERRGDDAMRAKGVETLRRTTAMKPKFDEEEIDIRHAAMLIDQPELACGYSRDGQQELDEAALSK